MNLSKVTMILRGYTYEQVRCVAQVLKTSTFVRNLEITLNTENAYDIIEKIAEEFQGELNVGAGTVQTYDELVKAVKAGAKFVLSPRKMSAKMLDYCKEKNVISVPGAFTPSEIGESLELGADIIKIFPANEVSLNYATKVCEPMGKLQLMAVGGISAENVNKVLSLGYNYVGTAGGLFLKEDIQNLRKDALVKSLKVFENELL